MSDGARDPDATTEQLRDDIDSARTGDKVAALDPAAAPLGTDDEAAGVRLEPGLVGRVRAAERARPRRPPRMRDRTAVAAALTGLTVLAILVSAYVLWTG